VSGKEKGEMEGESTFDIQSEVFNQFRKERTRVAVFLNSGRRLTGRIKSFDRFTLLLETPQGEQLVFKHAVASVGTWFEVAARPREGFANRMEIKPGRRGAGRGAPPEPPAEGAQPEEGDPLGLEPLDVGR
jgi:host factor-I protein